jgi:predicted transcriptional regulator
MSATTQAKPRGGRVRVLPVYESGLAKRWIEKSAFSGAESKPDGHVVTGYTGSAKKLKRLAEIAGMGEEAFIAYSVNHGFSEFGARLAYEAIGLSTAQGRKGKK